MELAQGMFAETLQTQDFAWNFNEQLERRDRKAEMRVAAILRRNGYFPDQRRVDGEKCRVWVRQKPTGRVGQSS